MKRWRCEYSTIFFITHSAFSTNYKVFILFIFLPLSICYLLTLNTHLPPCWICVIFYMLYICHSCTSKAHLLHIVSVFSLSCLNFIFCFVSALEGFHVLFQTLNSWLFIFITLGSFLVIIFPLPGFIQLSLLLPSCDLQLPPSPLRSSSVFMFRVKVGSWRGCQRRAEKVLEGLNLPERRWGGGRREEKDEGKSSNTEGGGNREEKRQQKITCCICFLLGVEEEISTFTSQDLTSWCSSSSSSPQLVPEPRKSDIVTLLKYISSSRCFCT